MSESNNVPHEHTSMKRLYRSRVNKMIGGVCGGIAEYFDVDPILVRIAWLLMTIFGGVGLLAYIVGLIIIPENPDQQRTGQTHAAAGHDKAMFWGTLLIILGAVLILRHFGFFYYFRLWEIPWQVIWAAFLIFFGVFLIYNRHSGRTDASDETSVQGTDGKQFYRVSRDKMVSGVCTGLSRYFDIDVTLIRLAWVVMTLASVGIGVLAYLIMVIVFPQMPEGGAQ